MALHVLAHVNICIDWNSGCQGGARNDNERDFIGCHCSQSSALGCQWPSDPAARLWHVVCCDHPFVCVSCCLASCSPATCAHTSGRQVSQLPCLLLSLAATPLHCACVSLPHLLASITPCAVASDPHAIPRRLFISASRLVLSAWH